MFKIIIGVIIVAFMVIGGYMMLDPQLNGTSGGVTEVAETFSYTIEGEVSKPGTYVLSDVVTMADLIEAAGGAIKNTDERSYYDDYELTSGKTYYIGGKFDTTDVCSNTEIAKVNINVDVQDTLMSINGITSSIASSIVSYRQEHGSFRAIEDLLEVYGIGPATYRKVRNYVILHG